MKRIMLGLWCLGLAYLGEAQTFDEWFEQNKTRKKYNAEQIAALQTYIGYAEEGYTIVESGLGVIREMKTGEFNLHMAFYEALRSVSPVVANMAEVVEIVAVETAMVQRWTGALSRYRGSPGLTGDELVYVGNVYAAVLKDGLEDLGALLSLLTPGELVMSDDQRMEGIRKLDEAMKGRYGMTVAFTDRVDLVSVLRVSAGADLGTVKGLYGLP